MTRAAVMLEADQPLEVVELELAPPAPDQVRVRLAAAGVCHSDLSARAGKMGWQPPLVLGHEGAGVVTEVGSEVSKVAVGDHVILAWNQPCRTCFFCERGEPHLCARATKDVYERPYGTVDGREVKPFLGAGAFADETLVLDRAVVPIDRDVPLEIAALVGCAVTTGVGAVTHTSGVEEGESVAVIGCGGVGLSVVQGARLTGADPIVAVDLQPEKLELAERFGATHLVRADETDTVKAIKDATAGYGADHVFEVLGRPATIRQAYEAARRGGTAVVVGVGSRHDVVEFNAMELFFLAKTIIGCVYGNADPDIDFPRILDLAASDQLDLEALVTDHVTLDEVDGALDRMAAGEGVRTLVTF
ncbi:MAG: Zn-dependent alcohol dehydrogenase [Nitriliruptorales bacterium]|nr:Zn-dependent alcohol dehydrogenase [Nitriliruptorales bacterium]